MLPHRRFLLVAPQVPNLLLKSEQFDNAAWSKTRSTVSADAATNYDGATTADKLVEDATTGNSHFVFQAPVSPAIGAHTLQIWAKAGERTQLQVIVTTTATVLSGYVNLLTGAITGLTSGVLSAAPLGDGWLIQGAFVTTGATVTVRLHLATGGTGTYDGDGASGLYLGRAQLTPGAAPQPYQRTV